MDCSRYCLAVVLLVATACSEPQTERVESTGAGGAESTGAGGAELTGAGGAESTGTGGAESTGTGGAPGTDVEPLDTGCEDEVCHVLLRLNASTLEVLGYAFQGAELASTTAAEAREVAQRLVDENLDFPADVEVDEANGGMYLASAPPSDFGGFVLVGEESGIAVAAGGIVWAGRGQYWLPTEWQSASAVDLGSAAVTPGGSHEQQGVCAGVASAEDALDVALRSNLAVHLADVGDFSSFSYLYTPAVGALTVDGCEPSVAEYLILLTQVK